MSGLFYQKIMTYLEKRLSEYGMNAEGELNWFSWKESHYDFIPKQSKYFDEHPEGIQIFTPTWEGGVHHLIKDKKKFEIVYRIRYTVPHIDLNGKEAKYKPSSTGYGSILFIPHNTYKKLTSEQRIKTLWVTEGEFKAAVADRWGLDVVSVPGIHNLRFEGKFNEGILHIINKCMVEQVVFLYDNDLFDLSSKLGKDGKNHDARPRHFLKAAEKFATLVKNQHRPDQLPDVNVLIAHPTPTSAKAGIDDLLKVQSALNPEWAKILGVQKESRAKFKERCETIISDLEKVAALAMEKGVTEGEWFSCYDITKAKRWDKKNEKSYFVLPHLFHLDSAKSFWDYHKTRQLKGFTHFSFKYKQYKVENDIPIYDDSNYKISLPIWREGNCYFKRSSDESPQPISTFALDLHYVIQVSQGRTVRIATMTDVGNRPKFVVLEKEDINSLGRFRSIMEDWTGFHFLGTEKDWLYIKMLIERESQVKEARQMPFLGYNKDNNTWVLANGAFSNKTKSFHKVDQYGIVNLDSPIFLPYDSGNTTKLGIEDDSGDDWIKYSDKSKMDLNEWFKLHRQVFDTETSPNGLLGFLYAVMCMFSDIVFKHVRSVPILAVSGPPLTGKTTFCQGILCLFGEIQSTPLSIQSISGSAANRIASRFCNVPIWLDEWKNSLPDWKQAFIKDSYNRSGKTLSKFTNNKETKRVQYHSAFMLSGQDVPGMGASDPAIFSRCIHISLTKGQHDDKIRRLEDDVWPSGISNLGVMIASHRDKMSEFGTHYRKIFDAIKALSRGADTRMITNIASLITPSIILMESNIIKIKESREELIDMAAKMVMDQHSRHNTTNEVAIFWSILDELFHHPETKDQIQADHHFRIKGDLLFLNLGKLYDRYARYGKLNNKRVLDKETLKEYLRGLDFYKEMETASKSQIFMPKIRSKQRCLVFDRKELIEATQLDTFMTPLERECLADPPEYYQTQSQLEIGLPAHSGKPKSRAYDDIYVTPN